MELDVELKISARNLYFVINTVIFIAYCLHLYMIHAKIKEYKNITLFFFLQGIRRNGMAVWKKGNIQLFRFLKNFQNLKFHNIT